jgi:DNA-binding HxlR family transcriptional regulator
VSLPKDYAGQRCSLSRALEVADERWTLLILRDAFFGVRRFGDSTAHLGVPRAVLTERLESLRDADVLAESKGNHGYREYVLTGNGRRLVARRTRPAQLGRRVLRTQWPATRVPACRGLGLDQAGRDVQRMHVVRLVFAAFRRLGTLNGMLRYLVGQEVQLPVRAHSGLSKGEIEWRRPNRETLQIMLHNPVYAGYYAYGRRQVEPAGRCPAGPARAAW